MPSYPYKLRKRLPAHQRYWVRVLSDRDRIRVEFTVSGKQVASIKVIQYEAEIAGQWTGLVRYDMAHGYWHRDIRRPDGPQEKLRIPYRDLTDAITEALDYIESNWEFYRRIYEEQTK